MRRSITLKFRSTSEGVARPKLTPVWQQTDIASLKCYTPAHSTQKIERSFIGGHE